MSITGGRGMKEWTNRVSTEIKRNYEWFEPEKSVLEHLQQHENILEIGSGMGRYTKLIPRIVGLEYSRLFIDYCKDNIEGIFLRADGFNIPIKDNVFDCVFSSGVIEHFDNPIDIIKEHVRVCKRGGMVIITVPAKDSPDYQRIRMWQKCLANGEERDWHYFGRRMSDKELQDLLMKAGLRSIKLFHLGSLLRGSPLTILKFLRSFFLKPSINTIKGVILEGVGIIVRIKLFRLLTFDFVFKKYIKTQGYYLFSKGAKIMNSKNQNVNIKIRSYDDLYKVLACPKCRKDLHKNGNYFFCDFCGVKYPLKEGTPFLTVTDAIKTLR